MIKHFIAVAAVILLGSESILAQEPPPLFTSTPTVLLRSPDPVKLAEFYLALGMKE